MATKKVTQQIKAWDDPFLACRDLGHAWGMDAYVDERRKTGEVVRELVCASCTTLRIDRVGAKSGEVYARRYVYPAGYLTPKGAFKRGEMQKTEIRAEAIRRLLAHGSKN